MTSLKVLQKVKDLYEKGADAQSISEQMNIDIDEVYNILDDIQDIPEEESEDEETSDKGNDKKKATKTVEEKMDSGAESTITSEVVKRTKGMALDIQKAKEELGDYVFHMFDNSGVPLEEIAGFVDYAINFFIENKDSIEALNSQLETAEEMIEQLWQVADEQSSKERIIREYVLKCAEAGNPVDKEFVATMLGQSLPQ